METNLKQHCNYRQALKLKQESADIICVDLYVEGMRKNYIRKWRKHRKLTLQKLADRMEKEPGVPVMSFVNLGKIERNEQSPTLEQLHFIAAALGVTVTQLIEDDPEIHGEVHDLMKALDDRERDRVVQIIKAAVA